MPLYRPEKFEDIRGHQRLVQFIRERIQQNTFPQFVLFNSEEGLGKTTLMKLIAMALNCTDHFKPCYECNNCKEITQKVIRENKDTQSVKTFRMSVEGGDNAAKEVIASFNSIIRPNQKRVIILDEGHGMSKSAQDTLLQDTEYIPKDTYILLATSEILGLKKQLVSRAVQFNLNRLPPKDLISLLKIEASRRRLTIQGADSAFELIVSWSENKARKALKVLEAMGEDANISLDTVKDFIDFLDVGKVIPIISSLANNGSIIVGINAITEMTTDQTTHRSLIEIVSEALKFSVGQKSFKLSNEDNKLLREAVEGVPTQRLAQFLYEIAAMRDSFSRQGLLASYLKCHPMVNALSKPNPEVLRDEMQTKFATQPEETLTRENKSLAPSLGDLLSRGVVLDES
jgi:DNA polymerase III gamma/tau subunit